MQADEQTTWLHGVNKKVSPPVISLSEEWLKADL